MRGVFFLFFDRNIKKARCLFERTHASVLAKQSKNYILFVSLSLLFAVLTLQGAMADDGDDDDDDNDDDDDDDDDGDDSILFLIYTIKTY